jgi:hypothetical protein
MQLTDPFFPNKSQYDFGRRKGEGRCKSRHTEAQMIVALKQLEAGRKAEDVVREVGVSKHTIYAWKAKYGGMDALCPATTNTQKICTAIFFVDALLVRRSVPPQPCSTRT